MPEIQLAAGQAREVVGEANRGDMYELRVRSGEIRFGRTKQEVANGRPYAPGDRGTIEIRDDGESVWAYSADGAGTVEVWRSGFDINLFPRTVMGSVQTSDGNEAAPASDAFVERQGKNVDVNASTVREAFEAPDRADFVVVSVDDATGGFNVAVIFTDGDGNEVTRRGPGNDPNYSGDATTDVFQRTAVAAGNVTVEIEDSSGAANPLDYSIYTR